MRDKLAAHPCFEPVSEQEIASDPAAQLLIQATEEGQKVARNRGQVSGPGCKFCSHWSYIEPAQEWSVWGLFNQVVMLQSSPQGLLRLCKHADGCERGLT